MAVGGAATSNESPIADGKAGSFGNDDDELRDSADDRPPNPPGRVNNTKQSGKMSLKYGVSGIGSTLAIVGACELVVGGCLVQLASTA